MITGLFCLALMALAVAGLPVRSPWAPVWLVISAVLSLIAALLAFGALSG